MTSNQINLLDLLLFPLYLLVGLMLGLLWVGFVVVGAIKTWVEDKLL